MAVLKKSTIVRTQRALVRAAFRTLDPVAPALAVRWATRIWCTPPRPRRARPARQPHQPGARFIGRQRAKRSEARGQAAAIQRFTVALPGSSATVVAEAWGDGPAVYLMHGWGGWRGQLTGLAAPLVAAGYRVVALDAPAHGESGPGRLGGRRTTLLEIAEALTAVVAVAGPAHAIIAHSGGATATAYAVRDGLTADRLIFLAPMADLSPLLGSFAQLLGLRAATVPRLRERLERMVDRPLAAFDVPAWAATADNLPPLLVIHDRGDREVRHADGHAIADAWPGAALYSTDGLGHRRILADPDVVAATVGFVNASAASGRSAAEPAVKRPDSGASQLATTAPAAGSSRRS